MEEKKLEETKEEVVSNPEITPESDFADETIIAKPVTEEHKEEKVEEKKPEVVFEKEETVEKAKEEVKEPVEVKKEEKIENKEKGKKGVISYVYNDEKLEKIEEERKLFSKKYKKENTIKWIISAACLVVIILGWVITSIPEVSKALGSTMSMVITLICVGISLVGLLVYSSIFKKKVDVLMGEYFEKFYELQNAYIYPETCQNFEGSVKAKLDDKALKDSEIYKEVFKVGSRGCYTFNYEGKKIVLADAAAQIQDKKALRTVFVGKYLYFDNSYQGSDILIYLKGNKRALPPTNLAGRDLYSDSKTMVIYGPSTTKKVLTSKVREALAKFDTNKTFIDMAIAIREGKTYIAMGYEDDLMVLPLETPFNPAPTMEAKKNIAEVLNLISALNNSK